MVKINIAEEFPEWGIQSSSTLSEFWDGYTSHSVVEENFTIVDGCGKTPITGKTITEHSKLDGYSTYSLIYDIPDPDHAERFRNYMKQQIAKRKS